MTMSHSCMDGVRSVTQLHHSLRHRSCKKEIENGFKEFVETYGRKPELAECEIIWKDSLNTEYVNIALTDIPEEYDNTIFFYCKSLSDLKSLADYGKEDFIVTGCINFTDLRNKT